MPDRRIDRSDNHTYRGVCICCNRVVFGKRSSHGQLHSHILSGRRSHTVPNSTITVHNPQMLKLEERSFRRYLISCRQKATPENHLLNWIASQHGAKCRIEGDRLIFGSVSYPVPDWIARVQKLEDKPLLAKDLLKALSLALARTASKEIN